MRDNVQHIEVENPVPYADNNAATVAAVAIDLEDKNAAGIFIQVGTMTGTGTFTPKLVESDDGSTWTDVPAAKIVGEQPAALVTDTDQKFGYNGSKQYIGVVVTKAGTVSAATFGVVAVLGHLSYEA